MLCEKCNTEMIYFKKGNSCGWNCPKCGNGLVTTLIDDIQLDENIYTVTLRAKKTATTEDLKAISKIASIPILEAKKKASAGGVLIEGKALTVKECISKLKETSLVYEVNPAFPYDV